MEKEWPILRKVLQELLKCPRADEENSEADIVKFIFELETRFISKPTVSSKTLRQLLLVLSSMNNHDNLKLHFDKYIYIDNRQ